MKQLNDNIYKITVTRFTSCGTSISRTSSELEMSLRIMNVTGAFNNSISSPCAEGRGWKRGWGSTFSLFFFSSPFLSRLYRKLLQLWLLSTKTHQYPFCKDKYLEFMNNSDCGLSMFTAFLEWKLYILEQMQSKRWQNCEKWSDAHLKQTSHYS